MQRFKLFKGGLLGLLCYLLLHFNGFSQSFFFAETIPSSKNYGEVSTTRLPKEAANLLRDLQLNHSEWSSFFSLKTAPSNPPVLGSYAFTNNKIVFNPRFLPDPSVTYTVRFSFNALNKILGTTFKNDDLIERITFLEINSKSPEVIAITPDITFFPKNILRLYVHFSSPMSFQNPYDFISLKDEFENDLTEPFVIVPEGLWNADRTRLTLLFHPGRIKRGVGPNMTEGDILEVGKKYALEISKEWVGDNGKSLGKTFRRSFTVTDPINETIQYSKWELSVFHDNGTELLIKTIHPLDQPIAKRMLFVRIKEGDIIPATIEFVDAFEIKISWAKQTEFEYELLIDPRLEDVCGNTPINTFDYENGNRVTSSEVLIRTFSVKKK